MSIKVKDVPRIQYHGKELEPLAKRGPKKGVKLLPNGKVDIEYMRRKDREPVTGVFQNHEQPGGFMSFSFYKYKGDPIEIFSFWDGETKTIPRMVANHINSNMRTPVFAYMQGEKGTHEVHTDFAGNMNCKVSGWKARCSFNRFDFDDLDEGADTDLVIVEKV
jgi:hypothetical protein